MDNIKDMQDYFRDTDIDKETLKTLMGREVTYQYIKSCEKRLNQAYEYLYKSLGFNSFYDMFVYCDLQKEKPEKYIEKTIERYGKDINLYKPLEENIKKSGLEHIESYKDLKTTYKCFGKTVDINELKKSLETVTNKDIIGTLEGNTIAEYYDSQGKKRGITVYKNTKDHLELKGYIGDRTIKGLGVKSFKEMINIAKVENNNIIVNNDFGSNAKAFLKSMGMKEQEGQLYMKVE